MDIHYEVQINLRWLEPWPMTHSCPSVFPQGEGPHMQPQTAFMRYKGVSDNFHPIRTTVTKWTDYACSEMKCHIKAQLIKVLVYFTYSLEKNFNGLHQFLALARGLLALLQCLDCLLKDSAESEHPVLRKRPKSDQILLICQLSWICQYSGTFWTFSQHRIIGLSWFLLYGIRLLEAQV